MTWSRHAAVLAFGLSVLGGTRALAQANAAPAPAAPGHKSVSLPPPTAAPAAPPAAAPAAPKSDAAAPPAAATAPSSSGTGASATAPVAAGVGSAPPTTAQTTQNAGDALPPTAATNGPDAAAPGVASDAAPAAATAGAATAPAPATPAAAVPPPTAAASGDDSEASDATPDSALLGSGDDTPIVGDSWGGNPRAGMNVGILNFRFLLQTRYTRTFGANSDNPRTSYREAEETLARDGDGWQIHRFFVRIGVDPSKYLELKTIVDLAELIHDNVDNAVKQAYVTLKPIPKHVEITAGVFKLPFSVLELDPIANYRLADTGEADSLIKDLGFGGRDIGAEIMVAPLSKPKRLRLAFGVFRGHAHDENGAFAGTLGARIETQPWKGTRFGIDWVEQPQHFAYHNVLDTSKKDVLPNPVDPQYPRAETWTRGRAFSADAKYQKHRITFLVEGMLGKRVDFDTRYGARDWAAVWAVLGYRFAAGPIHLMPVIRAEWLDGDLDHAVGLRRELSFALNFDITQSVRFVIDVSRTDVQASSPVLDQPKPLPEIPYFELDETRVVGQLQVAL